MVNRKDRRHSGRYTPTTNISRKDLVDYNIFVDVCYDDWNNHRDGFRDTVRDGKMIKKAPLYCRDETRIKRIALNKKQELLLLRRKARKSLRI